MNKFLILPFSIEQIAKRLKETEAELDALTKKSARLNNEQEVEMDKENGKKSQTESDSDSEMMDDEKNGINVRLGEEEDEEAVENVVTSKQEETCETQEKSVESEENTEELKPESAELTEDVSNEELADNI